MSGISEAINKGVKGTTRVADDGVKGTIRFVDNFEEVIKNPSAASIDDIEAVLKDSKLSSEARHRLENARNRKIEQAQANPQARVHEEPRQAENQKTNKTEKAQKTTDQKKEPPNSKKPKEPEPPKKDSNLGGKVKKAGVTGAIGTALLKIANDTVKEATQKGIRRSNINEDPHIISTYTGTGLREFNFLFPLIPPNSSKANEYIYALLTLKALISGLQLSESKSNILVSQDYIFTIEFGSKNPAIAETVKAILSKMLEIKENTEFNITGMTVDYVGLTNAESAIRPDGMPLGYSFKLDLQERRPLRMEEETQNAEISNKQNDKQQITDEVIDKGI